MDKPEFVTDEHLIYLDRLCAYLESKHKLNLLPVQDTTGLLSTNFPELSPQDAKEVLTYWLTIKKEQITNG